MNCTRILVVFDFVCVPSFPFSSSFTVVGRGFLGFFAVRKKKRRTTFRLNVTISSFFIFLSSSVFFSWLRFFFYFAATRHFHRYANTVVFDIQRPLTKLRSWYACIILCAVSHFTSLSFSSFLFISEILSVFSDRSVHCTIYNTNRMKKIERFVLFACYLLLLLLYVLALHIDWMLLASFAPRFHRLRLVSFFFLQVIHYF